MNIPFNPSPVVKSSSCTLKYSELFLDDKIIVVDTGGQTITLPTPIKDKRGKSALICNIAATGITLSCSSGFVGGVSTVAMGAQSCVQVYILPEGSGVFKWGVIGTSEAAITAAMVGTLINGSTAKATPVDADLVGFADTQASNVLKKATWANIKAFLKTYFDGVYSAVAHDSATTGVHGVGAGTVAKVGDIPSKAIGSDINTGTDDAKFLTAKAVADSNLAPLKGSVDWTTWTPTIASVPAVDTSVARYRRVGNMIEFTLDVRGSDGDDWTPSTITGLPVAPRDTNTLIPVVAQQKVNVTWTNCLAYIDAETNLRIQFHGASSCTNAAAWTILISGSYEVAA